MSEYGSEGLGEEEVRAIVRNEIRGRGEASPPVTPIADPAPVGFAGFALTVFLFSAINAGWLAQIGTFIPLALLYGGLAQLLAGMWAFRNNNAFGAVVFTSYGAFWGAMGFFFFFGDRLGVLAGVGPAAGFTLLGWTVFTSYLWIASITVNRAMFITFTVFMLALIMLDLGFLLAVNGFVVAGGYAGIVLAICAWYTSAAGVLNHAFGREILPLGSPFG